MEELSCVVNSTQPCFFLFLSHYFLFHRGPHFTVWKIPAEFMVQDETCRCDTHWEKSVDVLTAMKGRLQISEFSGSDGQFYNYRSHMNLGHFWYASSVIYYLCVKLMNLVLPTGNLVTAWLRRIIQTVARYLLSVEDYDFLHMPLDLGIHITSCCMVFGRNNTRVACPAQMFPQSNRWSSGDFLEVIDRTRC